jgi:hypothetical protein
MNPHSYPYTQRLSRSSLETRRHQRRHFRAEADARGFVAKDPGDLDQVLWIETRADD